MKTNELVRLVILLAFASVIIFAASGCASTRHACTEHYSYDGSFYGKTCRELN